MQNKWGLKSTDFAGGSPEKHLSQFGQFVAFSALSQVG
jgi:hypothetical protein